MYTQINLDDDHQPIFEMYDDRGPSGCIFTRKWILKSSESITKMALLMDKNLLTSVSLTAYDHVDKFRCDRNLEITIDADVFEKNCKFSLAFYDSGGRLVKYRSIVLTPPSATPLSKDDTVALKEEVAQLRKEVNELKARLDKN